MNCFGTTSTSPVSVCFKISFTIPKDARKQSDEAEEVSISGLYVQGEGKDKAGSYGIQGLGAALISEISGSYSNIVGLPMTQVMAALEWAGIHPKEN